MTSRGPFQPKTFYDSIKAVLVTRCLQKHVLSEAQLNSWSLQDHRAPCVYISFFFFFIPFLANLVQGLNSPDPVVKEKATAEAETRLHEQETSMEEESKTAVNRTVINTRASVRFFFPFEIKAV